MGPDFAGPTATRVCWAPRPTIIGSGGRAKPNKLGYWHKDPTATLIRAQHCWAARPNIIGSCLTEGPSSVGSYWAVRPNIIGSCLVKRPSSGGPK